MSDNKLLKRLNKVFEEEVVNTLGADGSVEEFLEATIYGVSNFAIVAFSTALCGSLHDRGPRKQALEMADGLLSRELAILRREKM